MNDQDNFDDVNEDFAFFHGIVNAMIVTAIVAAVILVVLSVVLP